MKCPKLHSLFIRAVRLLVALTLTLLAVTLWPTAARAATITLNNQASCEALGGQFYGNCRFYGNSSLNIAVSDVL
jgi:hypothetical protein